MRKEKKKHLKLEDCLQNVHGHGDCFYLAAILQLLYSPIPNKNETLEGRIKNIFEVFYKEEFAYESMILSYFITAQIKDENENYEEKEDFEIFLQSLRENIEQYNKEKINVYSKSGLENYPAFYCFISMIKQCLTVHLQSKTSNKNEKTELNQSAKLGEYAENEMIEAFAQVFHCNIDGYWYNNNQFEKDLYEPFDKTGSEIIKGNCTIEIAYVNAENVKNTQQRNHFQRFSSEEYKKFQEQEQEQEKKLNLQKENRNKRKEGSNSSSPFYKKNFNPRFLTSSSSTSSLKENKQEQKETQQNIFFDQEQSSQNTSSHMKIEGLQATDEKSNLFNQAKSPNSNVNAKQDNSYWLLFFHKKIAMALQNEDEIIKLAISERKKIRQKNESSDPDYHFLFPLPTLGATSRFSVRNLYLVNGPYVQKMKKQYGALTKLLAMERLLIEQWNGLDQVFEKYKTTVQAMHNPDTRDQYTWQDRLQHNAHGIMNAKGFMCRWLEDKIKEFQKFYNQKLDQLWQENKDWTEADLDEFYQKMVAKMAEMLGDEIKKWKGNFHKHSFGTALKSYCEKLNREAEKDQPLSGKAHKILQEVSEKQSEEVKCDNIEEPKKEEKQQDDKLKDEKEEVQKNPKKVTEQDPKQVLELSNQIVQEIKKLRQQSEEETLAQQSDKEKYKFNLLRTFGTGNHRAIRDLAMIGDASEETLNKRLQTVQAISKIETRLMQYYNRLEHFFSAYVASTGKIIRSKQSDSIYRNDYTDLDRFHYNSNGIHNATGFMKNWFGDIGKKLTRIYQIQFNKLLSENNYDITKITEKDFGKLYQTMSEKIIHLLGEEITAWHGNFNSYSFGTFMLGAYAELVRMIVPENCENLFVNPQYEENNFFKGEKIQEKKKVPSNFKEQGFSKKPLDLWNSLESEVQSFNPHFGKLSVNSNTTWSERRQINTPHKNIELVRNNIKLTH